MSLTFGAHSFFMRRTLTVFLLLGGLVAQPPARAQPARPRILFDATKAETAGNADWVIDADVAGSAQRLPTPAQSTVTATTAETYWVGAISSWGIALVQRGYAVETLPATARISYGDASNTQDLSNYAAYVVDEPNIRYTATEKTALLAYVRGGGGLFMISDHNISDRNGDGWDSPNIWNDLMSTATPPNPFGFSFDLNNLSFTTGVGAATAPADSLLHGPAGNPVAMEYHNGASLTLNRTANASVRGALFQPGQATTGSTGALVAHAHYGQGRVAALGDSSPPDDGTGAPGNNLYNGWSAEANGDHARLLLNATLWLATPPARPNATRSSAEAAGFTVFPNPAAGRVYVSGPVVPTGIRVFDALGRETPAAVATTGTGSGTLALTLPQAAPGLYVLHLQLPNGEVLTQRLAVVGNE